jgi:hypothetical protein
MDRPRLFHVSEEPGIVRFEPRPPPSPDAGVRDAVVWAVADSHLVNYLAPRDCPRIGFGAGPNTTAADRARFLGAARRVLAFEAEWLPRVRDAVLYLYEMPGETFTCALPEGGYWVSRAPVTPLKVALQADLLGALRDRDAEVRVLDDFWRLHDAVAASSLEFSILRKRNARPRQNPPPPEVS